MNAACKRVISCIRFGSSARRVSITSSYSLKHRPTFFSVYRAGAIPAAAWSLLAHVQTTATGHVPPTDARVDGRYITIQPGETVPALCLRYRCPVQQFWAWNGHLWDGVGRRRDPNLLQQGWIVRVG